MPKNNRSFEYARRYVHTLGLKNKEAWEKYCKSSKNPDDIPKTPRHVYKREWISWGDWLGTGRIASFDKKYRSFDESRKFVRTLQLRNEFDWQKYCKSGKLPNDIPKTPRHVYKREWIGTGDWLGTDSIHAKYLQFRTFEEAKKFVRTLGLNNQKDWQRYCKSGKKPKDIPANPSRFYKDKWKGYGVWLGTGSVAPQNRNFKSFTDARLFVRTLGLKDKEDWIMYCKSGNKPDDIPANPSRTYPTDWKSYGDWLGTGKISNQTKSKNWRSFRDTREFIRSLGLKNQAEWINYCKSGKKPHDIPSYPWEVYAKDKKNK